MDNFIPNRSTVFSPQGDSTGGNSVQNGKQQCKTVSPGTKDIHLGTSTRLISNEVIHDNQNVYYFDEKSQFLRIVNQVSSLFLLFL